MTKMIRVDDDFHKMILKFIQDFEKQQGIEISTSHATKIIYRKIQNKGGLTLD